MFIAFVGLATLYQFVHTTKLNPNKAIREHRFCLLFQVGLLLQLYYLGFFAILLLASFFPVKRPSQLCRLRAFSRHTNTLIKINQRKREKRYLRTLSSHFFPFVLSPLWLRISLSSLTVISSVSKFSDTSAFNL